MVLIVTPTVDPPIDLTWSKASEVEGHLNGLIGTGDKLFIKAEVSGGTSASQTDTSQVTLHAATLNGGLTVQQMK